MAYELAGPVTLKGTRVLVRIDILSVVDRPKDSVDYFVARVGIRDDGYTDWLDTFSTQRSPMSAGVPITIWQAEKRLAKGSFPVVELDVYGSPTTLVGSAVTFHMETDGAARGSRRALLSVASEDQSVRSMMDQVNQAGLGDVSVQIQLVDEGA